MSGITVGTALAISAGVAAVGTGVAIHQGNMQAKSAVSAQNRAKATADKQTTAAEQAFNAANKKMPNASGILDAANQAGRAGISGTMLTGASGVEKNSMALGRNVLLGQ